MSAPLIPHVFNDVEISQRRDDGYLNATAACKAVGKLFADYFRLETTQAFLEALSLDMGIPISKLVVAIKGRGDRVEQGTWVHPHVAVNLGQWLSPKFAVAVAKWVSDWIELSSRSDGVLTNVSSDAAKVLGGIVKSVVHKELCSILPSMVEAELERDARFVAVDYKPALQVLQERKVPSRKRRAFSQKVSSRLRRYCTARGLQMRLSRETGRYLFSADAIQKWLKEEGERLIADHVAAISGQGVLPFKKK